jgi:Reverse transcriptase (RNA-dependent DNA polymerase)
MDVPETTSNPAIVASYPTSTRQLRSAVVSAPKKRSRKVRSLQSNHVAYITQAQSETKDKAYHREFAMIQAAFPSVTGLDDGNYTPKTNKESLKHKNQAGWWASKKKDFHAMETKGVWEIELMSSMPAGRKVIVNRWALSDKDDGTLKSRTVAQGFIHRQCKDFTDSHATIMTDLAIRLALIIRVLTKLRTGQFDIKTAFLYLNLDEEIYMRFLEDYVRYMLDV